VPKINEKKGKLTSAVERKRKKGLPFGRVGWKTGKRNVFI